MFSCRTTNLSKTHWSNTFSDWRSVIYSEYNGLNTTTHIHSRHSNINNKLTYRFAVCPNMSLLHYSGLSTDIDWHQQASTPSKISMIFMFFSGHYRRLSSIERSHVKWSSLFRNAFPNTNRFTKTRRVMALLDLVYRNHF